MPLEQDFNSPSLIEPPHIIDANEILEQMIDLRLQMAQLQQEMQALKPAFFAACQSFQQNTIERQRAIIKRRLTPGKWNYHSDILDQEQLIKTLKQQFRQDHDPISGRDVIWMIQLILSEA